MKLLICGNRKTFTEVDKLEAYNNSVEERRERVGNTNMKKQEKDFPASQSEF